MYSPESTKKFQQLTEALIAKKGLGPADLADLRNTLRFHEYRYYVMNEPLISDMEYDQLFKSLEKIEAAAQIGRAHV